jgi:Protein of unknown function (DUF3343).
MGDRKDGYAVITFISTHWAIKAQTVLEGRFDIAVIPTPREISAGCGISVRIGTAAADEACACLRANGFADDVFNCVK